MLVGAQHVLAVPLEFFKKPARTKRVIGVPQNFLNRPIRVHLPEELFKVPVRAQHVLSRFLQPALSLEMLY